MYEEMIRQLRSECTLPYESLRLMRQAAGAIESLSSQLEDANIRARSSQLMLSEAMLKVPKWISVDESLPKPGEVVQITDGKEVGHGYLAKGLKYSGWMSPFCDLDEDGITHWMPLPDVPKE